MQTDRQHAIARRVRAKYHEPDRRWTATVILTNPQTGHTTRYTTVVHGPNPDEALRRYVAEHPHASVILREEMSR